MSYAQTLPWTAPSFAAYGIPAAEQMTRWLYEDEAQCPEPGRPEHWQNVGVVVFRDRTVDIADLGAGQTSVQTLDLTGGRNCLVFAQSAALVGPNVNNKSPAMLLPNYTENYVSVRIKRQDGYEERELTPMGTGFGIGGKPYILAVPALWLGRQNREWLVQNNSAETISLQILYKVAVLDTGR